IGLDRRDVERRSEDVETLLQHFRADGLPPLHGFQRTSVNAFVFTVMTAYGAGPWIEASITSVSPSTFAPRGTTDHPPVGFAPASRKTTDSVAKSTAGGSPPPIVAGQRRRYVASSEAPTACGASGLAAAYAPLLMVRSSTGPPVVAEGTAVH